MPNLFLSPLLPLAVFVSLVMLLLSRSLHCVVVETLKCCRHHVIRNLPYLDHVLGNYQFKYVILTGGVVLKFFAYPVPLSKFRIPLVKLCTA